LLEQAIEDQLQKGKKIAAIVVVHLYGMPAKMNELNAISEKFGIPIIEDAAEALGSRYNNKACGSFGKAGILSFNGNKIITTSGGGALLSNDEILIAKTRHVSAQAKDPAPYYLHTQVGYNYRLSNICAGIGRGQMEVLPERIEKRRAIFEQYKIGLADIEGITFLEEPNGFFSNRWLTTVVFDEKYFKLGIIESLRLYLETLNIESRPLWKPLHQQPVFAQFQMYNNGVSDRLFATGLCLPSGSNLSEAVIENVIIETKKHLVI
jgi:dTDP-4-amino-4,6-dideoxygalactose transaminase